jgi:hypothetical protein
VLLEGPVYALACLVLPGSIITLAAGSLFGVVVGTAVVSLCSRPGPRFASRARIGPKPPAAVARRSLSAMDLRPDLAPECTGGRER